MTAEFALAIHGLVYLYHRGVLITSEELADNICTNPARVRKVMTKLHKAGLITASEGKGSGYRISENGGTITMLQVLHALSEIPIAQKWRSGEIDRPCQISSGMAEVMDEVYAQMNSRCYDYLAGRTIADIDRRVIAEKGRKNGSVIATGAGGGK
ncbi:MAG: Rrf2 family transcriptional regulator [Butyrivibrio sp.]|nr:Rrf2 family transcriptional regulator [Butyrivibrio sp.]